MTTTAEHVAAAQALLDRAAGNLGAQVRGRDPDEVQMELYDLAFSAAELCAAGVALDYAAKAAAAPEAELKTAIAGAFAAEAVGNLQHRLRQRPAAFGLAVDDLDNDYLHLTQKYLDPTRLVELGSAFRHRDGRLPSDHLGEEADLIRATFREFAEAKVKPVAERVHRENLLVPEDILDGLRELGCFGLSVPAQFGGLKPDDHEDSIGMVVVTEELSRGSLGAAGSLITRPEILARALLEGGTEAQKSRWLPGIARGAPLCAISITEPSSGSDVANVALRATRTEGGWLLNGGKTWCTFAGKAEVLLVLARTDRDAKPAHRGLSLFIVEKPSYDNHDFEYRNPAGGSVSGRAIPTLGYRGMHSFEMFYDDFFVADDCVVGEQAGLGKGFYFTMRGFAGGRLQTAARAVGLMQAAFEAALEYGAVRKAFDREIASYPLTLQKLAKMGTYITVCRQFSYHVARLMDEGRGQTEVNLAKLLACRSAEWVTREALQIFGGMGYAEETAVSRYFVDARVLSIFEGAEETLAIKVIGRSLIGNA